MKKESACFFKKLLEPFRNNAVECFCYRINAKNAVQRTALMILEIVYCMSDNPVSESTHAVCAMPESPVNETAAADRIVFAC